MEDIEELAPELIAEKRHIQKGVSPNVDFYSGFVYEMLGTPPEQGNEKRKGLLDNNGRMLRKR